MTPSTTCEILTWNELTKSELYEVMCLRDLVFVVGQKITAVPELDGLDDQCAHVLLRDADGTLVGTARIFHQQTPRVVGRVAVHTDHQRKGLGSQLMLQLQEWMGPEPAELHAQAHLEEWYASLGWRRVGEVFEEAEIPHVTMVWGVAE